MQIAEEEPSRDYVTIKTYKGYRGDIHNHIIPHFGNKRLNQIDRFDIKNWQDYLLKTASPYVARAASGCLSSALTDAALWGYIDASPYVKGLRVPLPASTREFWQPSEAKQFLEHETVQAHDYYLAYYLCIHLGLRVAELRGLFWSDITTVTNFDGQSFPQIFVQRQAKGDKHLPEFTKRMKTQKSRRHIPLADSTLELLKRYKLEYDTVRASKEHWHNPVIIYTENGMSPTGSHLRTEFYELCNQIGLKQITLHGLRHTAGSLWLQAGRPLPVVSAMLGHSDTSITSRIYIHAFPEIVAAAGFSLDEI